MEHRISQQDREDRPALEGGFRLIAVIDLCRAWLCYREGRIRLYDLRLWFACHELLSRRCAMPPGRVPLYTLEEVHLLVGGVGGEHLRGGLSRLSACCLLRWGANAIDCSPPPADTADAQESTLAAMLGKVTNRRRQVPVPRRMLRFLARCGTRVVIATVLGHLLRCLYGSRGGCRTVGACKSSWVAATFGVDGRNVKAARKRLVALGWLLPLPCAQWYRNRFGSRVEINPRWAEQAPAAATRRAPSTTGSPPPVALSTTRTPPPVPNKNLLAEYKNQKPASRGPAGVRRLKEAKERRKPVLAKVVAEDLKDTARLLELFRQAILAGLTRPGECQRLQFVAAAEHALATGTVNPPGLFVYLIRRQLWLFITQADEDAARRRLKRRQELWPKGTDEQRARGAVCRGVKPQHGLSDCVQGILRGWAQRRAPEPAPACCIHADGVSPAEVVSRWSRTCVEMMTPAPSRAMVLPAKDSLRGRQQRAKTLLLTPLDRREAPGKPTSPVG